MTVQRYEHSGIAGTVDLQADIGASDLALDVSDGTGYPTGTTGHFFIVLHKGLANEEKVECTSRSGNHFVVTAGGRGADGTTPAIHLAGTQVVQHCVTALEHDNDSAHISDTTRDDHTQYLTDARHDITGRHTFGGAFGSPATPAAIGTAASVGSGDNPAKEDHVHALGVASINAANLFAAGVVDAAAIATDAVGTAEIAADAVTSSEIAADAVGTSELADGAVDAGAIAAGAISLLAKFAAGIRPYLVQSAQPSSPTVGDSYYDTDDGIVYWYVGATMGWVKQWGLPWGHQTSASVTTPQAGFGSLADATSVTVTWTAVNNRRYEIEVIAHVTPSNTDSAIAFQITDAANTVKGQSQMITNTTTAQAICVTKVIETGLSGSITRKLRVSVGSGTTSINSTTYPTTITVRDIGPSGNPS